MGNATTASVTGVQVAPAKSAIRDLPIAKVWAFAVGQFGWALLSGIISNWLVYFYQPDQETISQGQTVFVPQGLVVLGIVTVVGGITAFARFFDAFVDPAVASLSDRCDAKSGRRMPFLKFAALPLAVVTVLVFWSPINGTSWVNAAFLFVTVIGYYIALTFYCTPYNALIAELGHDSKQQLTISTAISFTWVAGTAIAYVAPVIWGAFVPMMGRITAIRVTFTIMAAVAFVCMLVPPLAIREKDYVNSHPTSESTIESLKQTFGDGEFRKFVCSDVVYWVAITTFQTGLPFFVTSLLKLPETTTTIYFVLMTGGPKRDMLQKMISRQLEQVIHEREAVVAEKDTREFIPVAGEEMDGVVAEVIVPIICEGDPIGAVALLSRDPKARLGEAELRLVSTAAGFLGRQMEG